MASQVGEAMVLEMLYHRVEGMSVEIGRHQSVEGGRLIAAPRAAIAGWYENAGNRLGADMTGESRSLQSASTGDTESQLGTPGGGGAAAAQAG
jgi:hypothetical protein